MATCETCRFWKTLNASFDYGGEIGDCRSKSPIVSGNDRGRNRPAWPQTFYSDWCNEHQPKEVQDE